MGKFIAYTVLGTLSTFAVIVYLSLWPYLTRLPVFAAEITPEGVLQEIQTFAIAFGISWIIWWSVSGLIALLLLSFNKINWIALFILSLAAVSGITALII